MKIIQCDQGSAEWLQARAGVLTASELDQLISEKKRELKTGAGPESYVCRKLAERWLGFPLQSFTSPVMEQGHLSEEDARNWYSATYDVDVAQVGFITTDDGSMGCSPDGIEGPNVSGACGLEIKCPQPTHHVGWLLDGGCPSEHYLQCQGCMYVTGMKQWRFVSFHRQFPKLVVDVVRDEKLMETIAAAVAWFGKRMDEGMKLLRERNGGSGGLPFTSEVVDGAFVQTLKGVRL